MIIDYDELKKLWIYSLEMLCKVLIIKKTFFISHLSPQNFLVIQ